MASRRGRRVVVESSTRKLLGVVALVYVLPVAAFLLGYFLSPGLAEGVRYAIAIGAAALMFVPIVAYDRYARRHETLTYTVVRRVLMFGYVRPSLGRLIRGGEGAVSAGLLRPVPHNGAARLRQR